MGIKQQKVLVLGDGLLGSELVKQTGWEYVSRKKNKKDLYSLLPIVLFSEADIIVNCIANTDTYSSDKESMMNVNYRFVVQLVDELNLMSFSRKTKKKLVQISTDYVYSNSIPYAKETDVPVHNATWYSYSKLLADGYIETFSDNYLIGRMGHKPKPFPYEKAWKNLIGNFDYVDEQVKRLIKLINNGDSGIVNVGGEVMSMYELAKQTKKDVEPNECDFPVPNNVTMNINEKFKESSNG
jgi:dTDP-4-dehydrorhamnose reductase